MRRTFFPLAFGFAFGILLQSLLRWPITLLVVTAPSLLLAAVIARALRGKKGRMLLLVLAGIVGGMLRFCASDTVRGDLFLDAKVNQKVELVGIVVREPDRRETSSRIVVGKVEDPRHAVVIRPDVFLLVSADAYSPAGYGDQILFTGTLRRPEIFFTENGRVFDYPSYLAKDTIFYQVSSARVSVLSSGYGRRFKAALIKSKQRFLSAVAEAVPEPESALLSGILLGTRNVLGEEIEEQFARTGTIHVVALSGYNVTIVADTIIRLFRFLPRAAASVAGAAGIILFAAFTGGGATVMRASLMSLIVLGIRASGNMADALNVIVLAGFLMLFQNPWTLVYDVSFQLSFLATIGLVFFTPVILPWCSFFPERFGLREIVSTTLSTNIFVLPFLLYQMGVLSVVALPANVLLLPFMPLTMLAGFVASLAAFVLPSSVSGILAFPAYVLLRYELQMIQFFAALPFASASVKGFPFLAVVACYAWFGWLMRPKKNFDRKGRDG